MKKSVRAYFYTENDAESAKAELQKYNVHNELVEPFPHNSGFHLEDVLNLISDKERLSHMLQFDIDEEHYDDALKTVHDHNGHIGEK